MWFITKGNVHVHQTHLVIIQEALCSKKYFEYEINCLLSWMSLNAYIHIHNLSVQCSITFFVLIFWVNLKKIGYEASNFMTLLRRYYGVPVDLMIRTCYLLTFSWYINLGKALKSSDLLNVYYHKLTGIVLPKDLKEFSCDDQMLLMVARRESSASLSSKLVME